MHLEYESHLLMKMESFLWTNASLCQVTKQFSLEGEGVESSTSNVKNELYDL